MAHAHRLHADDEGMGEGGEDEQHGGHAARGERAPGELHGVRDARDGIEKQQNSVHGHDYGRKRVGCVFVPFAKTHPTRFRLRAVGASGAKYPCLVRACVFGRVTRTTRRRQAPSRRGFLEV